MALNLQLSPLKVLLHKPKKFSKICPQIKFSIHNSQVCSAEISSTSSSPSNKSYVWVNPRSRRASKLRQKLYNVRHVFLVEVAECLDKCNPVEQEISDTLTNFVNKYGANGGDNMVEEDVIVILNHMSNPQVALLALKWFQESVKLREEVILYNVTIKVCRKGKDMVSAQTLFDEMLERGLKPDNVTFSTMISCARNCGFPEKAVEWFEKMQGYGCEPDDITYCVMIDAYGRAGKVEVALSLYDRARAENWRIDAVTFATLVKIYGMSGYFDGCLNVYQEMKALGVKPNVIVYNNLLDAMGRAKRPWQAKNIYKDMIDNGFNPNWATYAALLRAYARGRYGDDALVVYREMKAKGIELSVSLYNTVLAMCADVGLIDEALEIFEDMKQSETRRPDSWTYSSVMTLYSSSGKVSEAESLLKEMVELGFEPNIFIFTSLIQVYGMANRLDDVVNTFNRVVELGITPDERFCGCLLNVLTQAPKDELSKVTECLDKANPKLGYVVKLLVDGQNTDGETLKKEAEELFQQIDANVRKAYCNCLIDLCVNLDHLERACELLDMGLTLEIYTDVLSKTPTQWSLHLKSLSLGAALTALHIWMNDLSKALEDGEELPPLLGINTGHGKHKYRDARLAGVFKSHLKELNAPFHEAPDQAGWFLTTKVAATSWLESRQSEAVSV